MLQLALTFPAVLSGMENFPQIRRIHVSDGEFQFGFGEICVEFKFQKKQINIYGEFLRAFLILEQPTWQHCSPGSSIVVEALL